MKRTFFLLLTLFLTDFAIYAQTDAISVAPYLPTQAKENSANNSPITVQYPYEKMTMPRGAKNVFIFGQVNVKQPATLDINGQTVDVYKNGAFIAYVPVESGDFAFVLTATNAQGTVQAVRNINVPGTDLDDLMQTGSFDPEEIFPQHPVELLPADTINLYARATPQAKVTAHLASLKGGKEIILTEDSAHPGIYRGKFVIDPTQKPKTTKVVYKLKNGPNKSKAKITAPAQITVRDLQNPFTYAQINLPGVKVRKRPTPTGNLYPDYRAYGQVRVSGHLGGQSHLWFNDQESAWLEDTRLTPTKENDQLLNVLSFIRTETSDERTRFVFTLNRQVPIQIHEYKDYIDLTLYYVDSFEQNFSLDDTSPVVSNIQWAEPGLNTVAFRIHLNKDAKLWGHAYSYENNELILDLKHQPILTPTAQKPLAGARIVLDAGHSPKRTPPYDGAIGPTGYLEYEGTLALAEQLKPLLEKAGATVLLTRHGDNQMSLQNRYDFARAQQAHLFISLHYNALTETANPFARSRGFSVYYTYPHSFALAQSVYKAFTQHVPLPDNGLIANDVLFIPRMPDFPSILVENAYLMMPQQEQMARTHEGRAPFVKALYEGIVKFYQTQHAK